MKDENIRSMERVIAFAMGMVSYLTWSAFYSKNPIDTVAHDIRHVISLYTALSTLPSEFKIPIGILSVERLEELRAGRYIYGGSYTWGGDSFPIRSSKDIFLRKNKK